MVHLSPSRTKQFSNRGSLGDDWWRFSPSHLLTSVVGLLIVVFDAHSPVPFMKLFLYLLHYLLTMAYFRLHEIHSTLILLLPLVCVRNNSTLVAAYRIAWFVKPLTQQTICQRRHPLGCLVDDCSRSPTNIWRWCCHCGVSPS